jgi:gamma-glutamylcyclotransferase (GGCT)/AIG2-like uncharacterized protein YtfP
MPLLFVYGSLMNHASRAATLGRDVRAERAAVTRGYSTGWWFRSHRYCMTCLGMMEDAASASPVEGMLLDVDDADFDALDAREAGYTRATLPPHAAPTAAAGAPVQTYLVMRKEHPTSDFPITARYRRLCETAAP